MEAADLRFSFSAIHAWGTLVSFASAHALFGLSKLAVWWLRLGIGIERIKPGHPQQNGRHERIHLTLKKEATKPAAPNVLRQQAKFDDFIACYNQERPHQGTRYEVSRRALPTLTATVSRPGRSSSIRFTIGRSPSPTADGSASASARSI